MSRLLDHLWAANSCRRSISAALLAAYILTAAGIPLPYAGSHHSDELYPCANCACGCASAEHCWRSCCCHTLAERIAWAQAHNVRPPGYAIDEARVAGLDLAWLGVSKSSSADGVRVATCCDRALQTNLVLRVAKSSSPLVALTPNLPAPRITATNTNIQTSPIVSLPGERSLAMDSR